MNTAKGPRPDTPRLMPVTDPAPEVAEILDGAAVRGPGESSLNIFATLAHNPRMLRRFNQLGGSLLFRSAIPDREREIVILRVGWRARSVYEFGQHTVIGRRARLTDAEIEALASDVLPEGWSEEDQLLVRLADELCANDCVSNETWSGLSRRWGAAQLVELLVLAGFYRLVSGFLNSTGVALDPGVPGWPASAQP
ncbi:MAG TPA: carboxymuconolactone decarboxylase family protein [Acidimicrobiales bacterium]|nr:carboxymuconolactone decarboxylase family protein [Acidimicrobiales bacterium]